MKTATPRDSLMEPFAGYRYSFLRPGPTAGFSGPLYGGILANQPRDPEAVAYIFPLKQTKNEPRLLPTDDARSTSFNIIRILLRRAAARTAPFQFCAKDYDVELEACSAITKALVLGRGINWVGTEDAPDGTRDGLGDWDRWFQELDAANAAAKTEPETSSEPALASLADTVGRSSPRLRIFSLSEISYSGNRWRKQSQ